MTTLPPPLRTQARSTTLPYGAGQKRVRVYLWAQGKEGRVQGWGSGGGDNDDPTPTPTETQACSASLSLRCGLNPCSRAPREPAGSRRRGLLPMNKGDNDDPTLSPTETKACSATVSSQCRSKTCLRAPHETAGPRYWESGSGLQFGGGVIMTTLSPPLQTQARSASLSLRCGLNPCSRAPRKPAGARYIRSDSGLRSREKSDNGDPIPTPTNPSLQRERDLTFTLRVKHVPACTCGLTRYMHKYIHIYIYIYIYIYVSGESPRP